MVGTEHFFRSRKAASGNAKVSSNKLKLLVTIVPRSKAEIYAAQIQNLECNMQMILYGRGTASKEMLNLMGLADSEKGVIISVVGENTLPAILETIEGMFNTIKGGKGIAYTVPLSSVIGSLIFGFLSNNRSQVRKQEA